jgi:hypothetical protein
MKTLILSTYFSLKKHPNHPGDNAVIGRAADGRVWQSDFNYIKDWYESVVDNKLKAVLFYDNLSEDFVKSLENEYVIFEKVETSEYSNNDWRFFCFHDYLQRLKNEGLKPDTVFHTDASDVIVVKDPSELIKSHNTYDYFACKDSIPLKDFGYMKVHEHFNWEDRLMFLINMEDWWLINMGVIGGDFNKMLKFYEKFKNLRVAMGSPEFNADMWICQYLLRSQLQPCELLMGQPVCSEFKKYQTKRDDVYFIHK